MSRLLKTCPKCGSERKHRMRSDRKSLESFCTKCISERTKIWRIINPEKDKKLRAKYTKEQLKDTQLRCNFGITIDIYKEMLAKQSNKCAICFRDSIEFKKSLAVDHDHKTGKIRGLLCTRCNTALGHIKEDILTAINLVKYIETYKDSNI